MRKIKSTLNILQCQVNDWLRSPRTIIAIIILILFSYANAKSYAYIIEINDLYAYPGETAYYYLSSGFGSITLTSSLFLIMMSEIPRRTIFQYFQLIRTSKNKWLSCQVLFCAFISILSILFMLAVCLLFSIPSIRNGIGWSDLERIEIDLTRRWEVSLVEPYIINITPIQACFLSAFTLFFFWFTMTLILMFLSLCGKPMLGIILYASLLVLHITLMWEYLPAWMRYMPINFSTLSTIGAMYPGSEIKSVKYVLLTYCIIDFILIFTMWIRVKSMDMFFHEHK